MRSELDRRLNNQAARLAHVFVFDTLVFSLPYLTLVIVIVLAGLAGVAAAILPSRRAAKLNILHAIVTE